MCKISHILISSLLITNLVNAQRSNILRDTLVLPESLNEVARLPKGQSLATAKVSPFDWATQPLSEISYKSYGPSGVGSLSYRGLPASQTPIVWNGISLSSPLFGQVDINQIPLSSQWAAQLEGTDAAAIAGSQTASRVSVQMVSIVPDSSNKGLAVKSKATIGTYGQRQSESAYRQKQGQWQTSGRYFFQQAQNNFTIYRPTGSDPSLPANQINANTYNHQAEAGVSYRNLRNIYSASVGYLFNQSYRSLPPPITKYISHENLFAETQALSLQQHWRLCPSFSYRFTTGLIVEQSRYQDEAGVRYPYATVSIQIAGQLNFSPSTSGKFRLSGVSLSHSHSFAHPSQGDYGAHQQQSHLVAGETCLHVGSLIFTPMFGLGLYKDSAYPLPGLKIGRSTVAGGLTFSTSVATKGLFRAPTLNDLYYPTLGNPNLQAEQGRLYEIQLTAENRQNDAMHVQFALTPFAYQYQTFIAWIPRGNVWAPHQRSDARSSGITALAAGRLRLGKWNLAARQQVTWVQGGYGGPLLTLDARPEPFIYTPSFRSTSSLAFSRSNLTVEVRTTFTSTNILIGLPPLPAFFIHTARVEWALGKRYHQWTMAAFASWANPPGYAFIANYAAPHWWGNLTVSYRFLYAR